MHDFPESPVFKSIRDNLLTEELIFLKNEVNIGGSECHARKERRARPSRKPRSRKRSSPIISP